MGTETTTVEPLTDLQRGVLEFERLRWGSPGRKEAEILRLFGFQATRYYQILNTVMSMPAAEVYDAQLVRRLRRVRDERKAHRRRATASTHGAPVGKWSDGAVPQ